MLVATRTGTPPIDLRSRTDALPPSLDDPSAQFSASPPPATTGRNEGTAQHAKRPFTGGVRVTAEGVVIELKRAVVDLQSSSPCLRLISSGEPEITDSFLKLEWIKAIRSIDSSSASKLLWVNPVARSAESKFKNPLSLGLSNMDLQIKLVPGLDIELLPRVLLRHLER